MFERQLVVNADDFGLSDGINEGVAEAFENGIVTSASLMVRWPAASAAADYWRRNRKLSVGLHVDLGEWYLVDGTWKALYEVVPLDNASKVEAEVERQLKHFIDLTGRRPSHIDSHQHVHREEPVRSILGGISRKLGIPVRHFDTNINYLGSFYGQDEQGNTDLQRITPSSLLKILKELSEGITELACHPAIRTDFRGMYAKERLVETKTLCDPALVEFASASDIRLISFSSV